MSPASALTLSFPMSPAPAPNLKKVESLDARKRCRRRLSTRDRFDPRLRPVLIRKQPQCHDLSQGDGLKATPSKPHKPLKAWSLHVASR